MAFDEAPSRTEGMSEKDSGKVPESLEIVDASHRSQQMVGISEGAGPEAFQTEENAPSDSLGAIALALHQEEFSKSRTELSRREADFLGLSEERNALKLLNGQKEEEIKDLRAELAKAYQDQTDLTEQKKETARAQLSSAENQLQGMKEKSLVQERKIEEIEARLASELAKAKSEAEKAKAEADAFVTVYRADAEAAQIQAKKAVEIAQTWETLEEIHARGFDLTEEIKKAKELEADAGALSFDDDDEDDVSGSGSESGEEPDGEETAPGDNQET
ncbi:uncharacterized protein [Nicotiana tomentosiformis]|uniref:uncharacterized protein n=1 Tax=Nicotiana tomentosiformis TaxID=4098 RepID=UPI00388CA673